MRKFAQFVILVRENAGINKYILDMASLVQKNNYEVQQLRSDSNC